MTPTPTSISATLYAAADLLAGDGKWTQGAFARNAKGEITGLSGVRGSAVCYCFLGATTYASGEDAMLEAAVDRFLDANMDEDPAQFNDAPNRTQSEVVAKLRELAALASEQSK